MAEEPIICDKRPLALEVEPGVYFWCSCGRSSHQPYCDGSHTEAAFAATGEPPAKASVALAVRNGPLAITPLEDGPLHVKGSLELVSGTGHTLDRVTEAWLCRCGASANKPYCDGSHRKLGFKAAGLAPIRKPAASA